MKTSKLLFIFFAITTSSALAQTNSPLKLEGSFRLRAEDSRRTDYASDRDYFLLKVRPKMTFTKNESIELVFAPQFSKVLGDPMYTIPLNTGTNTKTGTSGSTTDSYFYIHEAFLKYKASPHLLIQGGRIIYNYGDELVIGALEWNNVGRAFDGFKVHAFDEYFWVDVFANKISENNSTATTSGNVDLYGLYSHFDFGTYLKEMELYLLEQRDASTSTINHLSAIGLRLASKFDQVDYHAEFTKEFGNYFSNLALDAKNAYQYDVEAGYTFPVSMKPRVGVEYFSAASAYQQWYPTAHKFLGFADVLSRRNVSGFVFHGQFIPVENLKLKADYHLIDRTATDAPAYKYTGGALGSTSASSSSEIGSEFDLTASYALEKDFILSGGACLFYQGKFLEDQFPDNKPSFFFIQSEVNF
jgi:hypothetical protein